MNGAVTALGIRDGDPAVLRALVGRRGAAVLAYCERACPAPLVVAAAADAFARFRATVVASPRPADLDPEAALLSSTRHAAADRAPRGQPPPSGAGLGRLLSGRPTADQITLVPELLIARADGTLDPRGEEQLNRLLDASAAARAAEDRFRAAEHAYRTAPPRTVAADAVEQIVAAMTTVPAPLQGLVPPPPPPQDRAERFSYAEDPTHVQSASGAVDPVEEPAAAEPAEDEAAAATDGPAEEPAAREPKDTGMAKEPAIAGEPEEAVSERPTPGPPAPEQVAGEPEPTEPATSEPEPEPEPEPTEPEPTEPEATEPEPTEPEATEPEPTEPPASEPEPTEPPAAADAGDDDAEPAVEWDVPPEQLDGEAALDVEIAAARLTPVAEARDEPGDEDAAHVQTASGAVEEAIAVPADAPEQRVAEAAAQLHRPAPPVPPNPSTPPAAPPAPPDAPAPAGGPIGVPLPRVAAPRHGFPGKAALAPAAAVVTIAAVGMMAASGVFGGNDEQPPVDTGIAPGRSVVAVPEGEGAAVIDDLRAAAADARQRRLADTRRSFPAPPVTSPGAEQDETETP